MKSFTVLAGLCLVTATVAVNMNNYEPGPGVEAGFKTWLRDIYAETEDLDATTTFTDYFPPTGKLTVLSSNAVGAHDILQLKQMLLPPGGDKHWNHFPNITTVYSEASTQKIYSVQGRIETTYTNSGGNCSAAYYMTRFTIAKNGYGAANLEPQAGALIYYDDFSVVPPFTPTSIACGQ